MDKFQKSVFDPIFHQILQVIANGNFINLTEDKLRLMDQVDVFYTGKGGKLPVSKPVFIKLALDHIGDGLTDFNELPSSVKQNLINKWNSELESEKNSH